MTIKDLEKRLNYENSLIEINYEWWNNEVNKTTAEIEFLSENQFSPKNKKRLEFLEKRLEYLEKKADFENKNVRAFKKKIKKFQNFIDLR